MNIKMRAWLKQDKIMVEVLEWIHNGRIGVNIGDSGPFIKQPEDVEVMMFTGLLDKSGKEIYRGDILRFSDKNEWYRCQYGPKLMFASQEERKKLLLQLEAEPFEERIVSIPEGYEWLLSSEIQVYWEIIGNIYENPELEKPC